MDRCRTIVKSTIMILFLMLPSFSVKAQFFGGIVFDPQNYIQNLYTASRSLVQIRQQVRQLQNEARSLINQGKNLTRLDYNAEAELMRILDDITRLNRQAQNVAYEVNRTRHILQEQFPDDYASMSNKEALRKAEAQWQMSRTAFNDAMVMQSALIESLQSDKHTLTRLITESQSATGNLSATQATNQLLVLLIKQNMAWQQMMVAGSRAEYLDNARLMAIEKESKARHKRFIGSSSAYRGKSK